METNLVIFPPGGKQYGFPKVIPNLQMKNLNEWLVENGYPQEEIDAYGKDFGVQIWEEVPSNDNHERLDTEED